MRHFDRARFAESTRQGTLRLFDESGDNPALQAFIRGKDAQKAG
jgi:hypothetical protein